MDGFFNFINILALKHMTFKEKRKKKETMTYTKYRVFFSRINLVKKQKRNFAKMSTQREEKRKMGVPATNACKQSAYDSIFFI